MDPVETFFSGIAPDHWPAVLAPLALAVAGWLLLPWWYHRRTTAGWMARVLERWQAAGFERRTLACLLVLTAVIHLALPLGHREEPVLNLLFLASGVAFAFEAVQCLGEGHWRYRAAFLLTGSIVAYLIVAGFDWREDPDQVGIVTKLVELMALALVIIPARSTARAPGLWSRLGRPVASAGVVALTFMTGAVIWIGTFVAHSNADANASQVRLHAPGGHHHDLGARAEAGIIVRPASDEPPTAAEADAANHLADATRGATVRFSDYNAALASGYVVEGPQFGVKRHLTNKAYQHDGHVLDPERPEQLVFAVAGQQKRLLGVVYQMETAGAPGPTPGGSITNWHAHNICLSLLPPAFGLVSPFGSCPLGAVALTTPEMMHVWVVDNPGGPFADDLDDGWVRKLLKSDAANPS